MPSHFIQYQGVFRIPPPPILMVHQKSLGSSADGQVRVDSCDASVTTSWSPKRFDDQMQLMLLEQQRERRDMTTRNTPSDPVQDRIQRAKNRRRAYMCRYQGCSKVYILNTLHGLNRNGLTFVCIGFRLSRATKTS